VHRLLLLATVTTLVAMPALASHTGDDWNVLLRGLFMRPDGTFLFLTASWATYADWPVHSDPLRTTGLDIRAVPLGEARGFPLAHPGIRFLILQGDPPRIEVQLEADGLSWSPTWTWRSYTACGPTTIQKARIMLLTASGTVDKLAAMAGGPAPYVADVAEWEALLLLDHSQGSGNPVRGDLMDGGGTTLDGEHLQAVPFLPNPEGGLANGDGGAQKVSPGADGWWNCNSGALVPMPV
jgi:hypothetical protein